VKAELIDRLQKAIDASGEVEAEETEVVQGDADAGMAVDEQLPESGGDADLALDATDPEAGAEAVADGASGAMDHTEDAAAETEKPAVRCLISLFRDFLASHLFFVC
jgi:hypothetical protein